MTAEIAILNKGGVALAADSAVTVSSDSGPKIYNSVSKLFALSKYHPVGIMVFGNAEFMTVPWELIVKLYRSKLGREQLDTIEDYVKDFIDFVGSSAQLFTVDMQEAEYASLVRAVFEGIKKEIGTRVGAKITTEGSVSEADASKIVTGTCLELVGELRSQEDCAPVTADAARMTADKYKQQTDEVRDEVFEELPMSKKALKALTEVGSLVLHKELGVEDFSGVVIAGYGSNEHFPVVIAHQFRWLIDGHLGVEQKQDTRIGWGGAAAAIIPFAQREMVDTFIAGIAPGYRQAMRGLLEVIAERVPELAVGSLSERLQDPERLITEMQTMSSEAIKEFTSDFDEVMEEAFVRPIVSVVEVLPKDELAAMAEALVNLTSFKRKMSLEAETVGGPIDVAIISKGDGFIWIKRKHYFTQELNPQFLANYFRQG